MKFRNVKYFLLFLLAAWSLVSCNEQEMSLPEGTGGEKVNWRIGVTIPGAGMMPSRSFANPDLEFDDLYVAVFVEAGGDYFFEELVRAADTAPVWNESNKCWDFNVALTKTDGPRRLHLIGNYPGLTMGFGEEGQLVGRLITNRQADGHDVYWNYVEVTKIDAGFESEVQKIPLVRNYARIELNMKDEVWNDFQLTRYALYNVPQWGTVAPYNSLKGSFTNFVTSDGSCQSYSYLLKTAGYEGNEPNDDGELFSKELQWVVIDENRTIAPSYIYERSNRLSQTPTSMIVAGRYKEGDETFYKLDFVYHDTETGSNIYYNLLRNFCYTMNINSVVGNGYATPNEAINNPASNNIGGDAIAKDYTNISDGVGRLFVSTTYQMLTNGNLVDVYYQYIPNVAESSTATGYVDNGDVVVTAPSGTVLKQNAIVAGADETSGIRDRWRKVTLVPKEPTAVAQSQTITFAAGGLQREIELVLRSPYNFIAVETPKLVDSKAKKDVLVKITLPTGIASSLFPLRLFISSENNTIYPNYGTNMPAETINGKYGFIREVSWDEYNENKVIECEFLTNCTENATEVYVENDYFNRGEAAFDNEWEKSFTIGTSILVDVQKNNTRYPQKIYNNGNNNGTESISFTYNGSTYNLTIDRDNVTNGKTLQNNAGIDPSTVLTFTFTDKYYAGNNNWVDATYTATCTIRQLMKGTTLTFTAPTPADVVFVTDASIGVKVQRSNWRYPKAIYNNGNNSGTETVTVKMGNADVGTVTIDKDNVTSNIELYHEAGFEDSDVLTFVFEDYYYTSNRAWSGNKVTYTATCTVNELKNGTTLEFTSANADRTTRLVIESSNFAGVTVKQDTYAYGWFDSNSVNVYPENIHNNRTETVSVYYRGSLLENYSIKINANSIVELVPSTGIVIENPDEIELTDLVEFKFTDKRCTGIASSWGQISGYKFEEDPIEYSTSCTIEELISGNVNLNFKP